ncbi:hypothetical protein [Bacillus sp. 123MFChir2]|uniref:hypothetical protein n=1 Tax=Bacillus sp. 123MFChir2 TaxID=1169144 RepID=UPI000379D701|nr:hypothetical protein [Bacillus sp. 123MFChir2]
MFKIKITIKKGKKHSAILLLIAFIALIVTDIIGNLYLSAAAVIFGMAVVAAAITETIGDWRKKKEKGTH